MKSSPNARTTPDPSSEAGKAGNPAALLSPASSRGANVVDRTGGGQFRPGFSGNPTGRPRSESAALRQELAEHAGDVVQSVLKAALSGDMTAAKMILDRVLPPLRPQTETVQIAREAGGGPVGTAEAVIGAAIAGRIPPDTAVELLSAATSLSRIIETAELKARLEALERAVSPHKPKPR